MLKQLQLNKTKRFPEMHHLGVEDKKKNNNNNKKPSFEVVFDAEVTNTKAGPTEVIIAYRGQFLITFPTDKRAHTEHRLKYSFKEKQNAVYAR